MGNPKIKIKRLAGSNRAAGLPLKATSGSAGFDLLASNDREIVIEPGKRALVPTGLLLEIPAGYEAQLRPRSGLAWKYGITMLNTPGTIDSDYRGEVKVILVNLGAKSFVVRKGDRIAQMVLARYVDCRLEEAKEVSGTKRGRKGFGSSGINSVAGQKSRKKSRG